MTLLEHCTEYTRRGFYVVPVPSGRKGPVISGWQQLRIIESELHTHFNGGGGNVGILLGLASGGLVDIDLDCEEARNLADEYLPPTEAITGRPGAPRSHWWYRAPVAHTQQFRDKRNNEMIVEIRSNNCQTLVGPSIHPETGERYDVLEGNPTAADDVELLECVKSLYSAVLLRRYGSIDEEKKQPPAVDQYPQNEKRARAYISKMPASVSGSGGHNAAFRVACVLVHGFKLPESIALSIMQSDFNVRCDPPWSDKELEHKIKDAATKPHDLPAGWIADKPYPEQDVETKPEKQDGPKRLSDLVFEFPELRPPIIDGLLRQGETLNVISSPKAGKSWLVLGLSFSVAMGVPWLGMNVSQGDVLILDNELHNESISYRASRVAESRGISLSEIGQHVFVESMRGKLKDIVSLGEYFKKFPPGRFRIIVLDALYRFLPSGIDENSNADMASIYNYIDSYANALNCAFVLVHHSSKGNQSDKGVTDVGSGAGALARATDSHLILRQGEIDGTFILEAVARSFKPLEKIGLRWQWPLWSADSEVDVTKLKKVGNAKEHTTKDLMQSFKDNMTSTEWSTAAKEESGISERTFYRLKKDAMQGGLVIQIGKEFHHGPPKT